jgi:hypothetical protein
MLLHIRRKTAMGIASMAVPVRAEGEIRYALSVSAQPNFAAPIIVARYLPELPGTPRQWRFGHAGGEGSGAVASSFDDPGSDHRRVAKPRSRP